VSAAAIVIKMVVNVVAVLVNILHGVKKQWIWNNGKRTDIINRHVHAISGYAC